MSKFSAFIFFLIDVLKSNNIIRRLSISDFNAKYAGSLFGILWAFIQPLMTMLVLWCVFQLGFKNAPMQNVPFFLWLICGYIPWSFFSDAFNSGSQSLLEYNYLVKKVLFRTSILPIVKILSSLYVHFFFIVFILIVMFLYGYSFSLYNLQIIYYLILSLILILGLSWAFSAIGVFFRDAIQILNLMLQIGFWVTPIFWSTQFMPEKYLFFFKLNPMFYVVQGYRDSFIDHHWFWERPLSTIYFGFMVIIILSVGATIFRKLKPHFADVL